MKVCIDRSDPSPAPLAPPPAPAAALWTPASPRAYVRVKDFERVYIISQNARVARWSYVPFPIKFDGEGYIALVERGREGLFALGVFKAIVDVAANMPVKGHLWDHDGPVGVRKLARITRISSGLIQEAMAILVADDVKWLLEVEGPPAGYGHEPAGSTSEPRAGLQSGVVSGVMDGPQWERTGSAMRARSERARSALEPEQQRAAAAERRGEQNQEGLSFASAARELSGASSHTGAQRGGVVRGHASAAAGPAACGTGVAGWGAGWRSVQEALTAIGVGEPIRSDLAGSAKVTLDLVRGEWTSITGRRGIVDKVAALTTALMRHAGIHTRSEGQAANRRLLELRAKGRERTAP